MLICASDTYACAVPAGPMAWQPVLLRSWAPGDEAHFNAAAATKMPPPAPSRTLPLLFRSGNIHPFTKFVVCFLAIEDWYTHCQ